MPNIASILKVEISRIARKEVRAEIGSLKKQSTQYRSQVAALKRQVANLEKMLRKKFKGARAAPAAAASEESPRTGLRFRSKGFAAHRQRLGLSAAQAGALLGVSGQTIYHWEDGKTKPRASQLPRIDRPQKAHEEGGCCCRRPGFGLVLAIFAIRRRIIPFCRCLHRIAFRLQSAKPPASHLSIYPQSKLPLRSRLAPN